MSNILNTLYNFLQALINVFNQLSTSNPHPQLQFNEIWPTLSVLVHKIHTKKRVKELLFLLLKRVSRNSLTFIESKSKSIKLHISPSLPSHSRGPKLHTLDMQPAYIFIYYKLFQSRCLHLNRTIIPMLLNIILHNSIITSAHIRNWLNRGWKYKIGQLLREEQRSEHS